MTADVPTLTNPPIVEAIIEFRFKPNADANIQQLEDFAELYKKSHPTCQPLTQQSLEVVVNSGQEDSNIGQISQSHASSNTIGFRLENVQGNRIIIGNIDRLIVSILSPYASWPTLQEIALDAYCNYRHILSGQELIRVGMRYINRLEIAIDEDFDFDDYLNTMPPLPFGEHVPQTIAHFETAVTIPFVKEDCIARILQAIDQNNKDPNKTVLIVDIDVYFNKTTELAEVENLGSLLENMRIIKNRLFFGSLTDKALEAYR